jgi:GTP-binding protein Era
VALKRVSSEARKSLEKFFGKSIYLDVFVKVDKDWRSSSKAMKQYGYDISD